MSLMRVAVAGLAFALASTEAKTVEELTAEYAKLGDASCAVVLKKAPQLPVADQAAFMKAYQAFKGSGDEKPVIDAAAKVLANKQVAAFLALPDSFGKGGYDTDLVQCAVIRDATPFGLANFSVQGTAQEALVDQLLNDPVLMRDILLSDGAVHGKYGEAMSLYSQMVQASAVLQAGTRPTGAAVWQDRNQSSVLHRLALGTAIHQAVPIALKWGHGPAPPSTIDAVARYLHYERAYLAGELDPWFEVLTAWELRYASAFTGPDEDLTWMREAMYTFRPEHVVIPESNYDWRYCEAVRTDVAYGTQTWPNGVPSFRDIPAAGGKCGARAWFGRFNRRAFGVPTWGIQQPEHAAMTTWTPEGWKVNLGADWSYSQWRIEERGGPDFYLETQTRGYPLAFQRVLRGTWAAKALEEPPVARLWGTKWGGYGTGGNWSALMLYKKKIATQVKAPAVLLGPSVVPTKVAALIARWPQPEPTPNVTVGPDGSITIPAVTFSWKNTTASLTVGKSADGGQQLMLSRGNFADPSATSFEYVVDSAEGGVFYFTANITTWHTSTDLQLTTNTTKAPLEIPVFYTVGYWKETQPVEVTLLKGLNVLRFTRALGAGLVVKEFFLLKQKPILPPVPGNYTPAPAPPPADDYIKLAKGLTCTSQGILALNVAECHYACGQFGKRTTGTRPGPLLSGCWLLATGPYAGDCGFNSNSSAVCCGPDTEAICLRK